MIVNLLVRLYRLFICAFAVTDCVNKIEKQKPTTKALHRFFTKWKMRKHTLLNLPLA